MKAIYYSTSLMGFHSLKENLLKRTVIEEGKYIQHVGFYHELSIKVHGKNRQSVISFEL